MAKQLPSFVRLSSALLAWLVCLALAPAASFGQSTDVIPASVLSDSLTLQEHQRLTVLEGQLQELLAAEQQRKAEAAQSPTFEMHGLIQIDYLFIDQNAANRASVGGAEDVFGFRRARLTASGEAFDVVEYAVGFDFALAGRPSFLDNWVAVRDLPLVGNFRVGHFFEPFSLERYTLVRYTTFMERSLPDTFAPARNLGMMIHDTVGAGERGTWAVGGFRSNSDVFGDDFSDTGAWAVTSRATWLPYYDDACDGRSLLHLGMAYSYRSEDERGLQFSSFPEARAGSPGDDGIPPFVDTGVIAAHSDQRLGTEIALVRGPLYVQAEYIATSVDQIGGQDLYFHAAYGYVSYFLTGEHRTYDKQRGTFDRVYPFENFFRVRTDRGIETGRGAWEVAARWSMIDLDSRNVQGGRLNDLTLGLTWHLNPYTRVKWEYIHARLNLAPAGESSANIAGMRFDIDF